MANKALTFSSRQEELIIKGLKNLPDSTYNNEQEKSELITRVHDGLIHGYF